MQRKRWDSSAKACMGRERKARKGLNLSPLKDSSHLSGWAVLDFEFDCSSGCF